MARKPRKRLVIPDVEFEAKRRPPLHDTPKKKRPKNAAPDKKLKKPSVRRGGWTITGKVNRKGGEVRAKRKF